MPHVFRRRKPSGAQELPLLSPTSPLAPHCLSGEQCSVLPAASPTGAGRGHSQSSPLETEALSTSEMLSESRLRVSASCGPIAQKLSSSPSSPAQAPYLVFHLLVSTHALPVRSRLLALCREKSREPVSLGDAPGEQLGGSPAPVGRLPPCVLPACVLVAFAPESPRA